MKSKSRIISGAVVVFLVMTACNGTFQIGLEKTAASPSSVATQTTATTIPPSPTPQTPTAATTVAASSTPRPAATSTPAAVNIVMAPGTTAAEVRGTIQPGQVIRYALEAAQSQPMILIMNSPNNDVTLGVFEPNGNMLLNPANKWIRWQGLLPRTEPYTIHVIGGATKENFTLTAKAAKLVNFAPGATSITLSGKTVKGYVFSYALSCSANQTMTASLNVPSSTAYIDIFGIATGSLLSSAAKASTWTGILPKTQDYVIEVIPANGQVVNYSLTVSVK